MKRFLICTLLLLGFAAGSFYLVCYRGLYIDLRPEAAIDVPFRTEGREILIRQSDGGYAPFGVRGVDLLSAQPGEHFSDYACGKADYLRYLAQIQEMGANTVRIYTIMDDDFYNALYEYNTSHDTPLFLLQGIQVDDAANYGDEDAYHPEFLDQLLAEAVAAVDVIHGLRFRTASELPGGGYYFRDVSPWVLGYLVGNEWVADTIAYTDNSAIRSGLYAGEYFSTVEEATPFEAMLARVMDRMVSYETGKYKTQRLIGFISAPDIDFLTYEPIYARQLYKYAWLDAEHILPASKLESGYYTAYRMFDFCEEFSQYVSSEQIVQLGELLDGISSERSYGGYLDLLGAYHSMPVVITAGFSTSRGAMREGVPPLTEEEQGEALVEVWRDCMAAELAGMCITAWQDNWEARTWNTAFAIEPGNNYLWHDLFSDRQNTGLLDFEPGEDAVCLPDGDPSEWAGDTPVLQWEGIALYLRTDQEGLYLLLQGGGVKPEQPLYLPIDLSKEVGSTYCAYPALEFDRAAEFILRVNGTDYTRLLVHERYNAMRMNFSFEQGGADPFINVPEQDSGEFSVVEMAVDNTDLIDLTLPYTPIELRELRAMRSWGAGMLIHGSGDPAAEDYNSLADFCFGENCVELRLPWLLLNVSDPSDMQVHRDYYEHYGVENDGISGFWIGLGDGSGRFHMASARLSPLGQWFDHRERLKDSYYAVQSEWKCSAK